MPFPRRELGLRFSSRSCLLVLSHCAMLSPVLALFLDWKIRIANSSTASTKICQKRHLFSRLYCKNVISNVYAQTRLNSFVPVACVKQSTTHCSLNHTFATYVWVRYMTMSTFSWHKTARMSWTRRRHFQLIKWWWAGATLCDFLCDLLWIKKS